MPLSEEEQRLLDELEASLSADDPHLARTLRDAAPTVMTHSAPSRDTSSRRRRALAALVGVALGLAVLVAGVKLHPMVGVLGFVVMLLSLLLAGDSLRRGRSEDDTPASRSRPAHHR